MAADTVDATEAKKIATLTAKVTTLDTLLSESRLETRAWREVVEAILADPFGCPMCRSGTLNNPGKTHWAACGFGKAETLLRALRHAEAKR